MITKKISFRKVYTALALLSMLLFLKPLSAQEDYTALNVLLNLGKVSAINASYEIQVADQITVGPAALIDFDGNFGLGGRGFYYFDELLTLNDTWDVYAGLELGYRFGSNDLNLGIFIGGEWRFNDKLGLILEFSGGSISFGGGVGLGIHF